jgi:hypothetical protein
MYRSVGPRLNLSVSRTPLVRGTGILPVPHRLILDLVKRSSHFSERALSFCIPRLPPTGNAARRSRVQRRNLKDKESPHFCKEAALGGLGPVVNEKGEIARIGPEKT